jgi:hypothetical protein
MSALQDIQLGQRAVEGQALVRRLAIEILKSMLGGEFADHGL